MVLAIAIVALVAANLSAAQAAGGGEGVPGGVLEAADATLLWSGSFSDAAAPSSPDVHAMPAACETLPCREFLLEVSLPDDVWEGAGAGGVEVAVDWSPAEENDLDRYVYGASGSLVARSDGAFASTGESVRLRNAENGRYRVVLVPRLVQGEMRYRGFVEVEWQPNVEPLRPLLPNLVALPPRQPHLRTGAYFVDHRAEGTPSCYPEELVEDGAKRCLRFDQIIANHGDGPFELRYRMDGLATDQQLRQRIYSSDGTFLDAEVDTYEFHATHAHFHYKSFGQAFLYRLRSDGLLQKVRESKKNGFCLVDVENTRFGTDAGGQPNRGEAPRTYYFPRCNAPTERDATGVALVSGISAGWADVYNWFLADQYIEISGVPDGLYVLETVANPAQTVHETTLDDIASSVLIQLEDDTVELVGEDPDQRFMMDRAECAVGPISRANGRHRVDGQWARAPPLMPDGPALPSNGTRAPVEYPLAAC